jgi:hypothetical protein
MKVRIVRWQVRRRSYDEEEDAGRCVEGSGKRVELKEEEEVNEKGDHWSTTRLFG